MGRNIANIISKKKREYDKHIIYDKEFRIRATKFPTNNKEQCYEVMKYIKDITEDGKPIYKRTCSTSLGFKRKPYITASNDLFDKIRNLPKQAYILFKYIIDNIDYDNNYIILTTDDVKHILNTKHQPIVSKAMHDLIDAELICKCIDKEEKNTYCINHQDYFKGNFTNFIIAYNNIYKENDKCNNREHVDG